MLIINQEARFPIYRWVSGVGFVDAGNVFSRLGDIALGDLAVGSGAGLRFDSPVGMLRVDYAFALSRGDDDPVGRFFFSIGQAF